MHFDELKAVPAYEIMFKHNLHWAGRDFRRSIRVLVRKTIQPRSPFAHQNKNNPGQLNNNNNNNNNNIFI